MAGMSDLDAAIRTARSWIDAAERVVVLTGAGISTDSGIPDFRGPQGLWTKDPDAEKMATIQHYMADPAVRARSWQMRLSMCDLNLEPNPGHTALVELERRGKLHTLITQNVDGLHQRAGSGKRIRPVAAAAESSSPPPSPSGRDSWWTISCAPSEPPRRVTSCSPSAPVWASIRLRAWCPWRSVAALAS
jgi:hypothetical protein